MRAIVFLAVFSTFLSSAQDTVVPTSPTSDPSPWYIGGHATLGSSFRILGYDGSDPVIRGQYDNRSNNELFYYGRAFGVFAKYMLNKTFFLETGLNYRMDSYRYELEVTVGTTTDSLPDVLMDTKVKHTTLEVPLEISMIAGNLPRLKFSQSLGVNVGWVMERTQDTVVNYRFLPEDPLFEAQNTSVSVVPDLPFRLSPTYGIGMQFIHNERFHFVFEGTVAFDALKVMRDPISERLFSWGARLAFFARLNR